MQFYEELLPQIYTYFLQASGISPQMLNVIGVLLSLSQLTTAATSRSTCMHTLLHLISPIDILLASTSLPLLTFWTELALGNSKLSSAEIPSYPEDLEMFATSLEVLSSR